MAAALTLAFRRSRTTGHSFLAVSSPGLAMSPDRTFQAVAYGTPDLAATPLSSARSYNCSLARSSAGVGIPDMVTSMPRVSTKRKTVRSESGGQIEGIIETVPVTAPQPMPNKPSRLILSEAVAALSRKRYGRDWAVTQIARDCSIGAATVTRVREATTSVGLDVVDKLAEGLGVTPAALLMPDGRTLGPAALTLAQAIDEISDPALQRRVWALCMFVIDTGDLPDPTQPHAHAPNGARRKVSGSAS